MIYPTIINKISNSYNEALILVEINDVGQQVSDILYHDLENTNLISIMSDTRKGQSISSGFGSNSNTLGIRTTKATKKIGCMNMKSLIEEDKLYIRDYDTINELTTFVQKGPKYEAERGRHDDLVDTLILFSWMTTDPYFKSMCDIDTRKEIYDERMRHLEENMLPFGFVSNGFDDESFVDDSGDLWTVQPDDSTIRF